MHQEIGRAARAHQAALKSVQGSWEGLVRAARRESVQRSASGSDEAEARRTRRDASRAIEEAESLWRTAREPSARSAEHATRVVAALVARLRETESALVRTVSALRESRRRNAGLLELANLAKLCGDRGIAGVVN